MSAQYIELSEDTLHNFIRRDSIEHAVMRESFTLHTDGEAISTGFDKFTIHDCIKMLYLIIVDFPTLSILFLVLLYIDFLFILMWALILTICAMT